MDERLSLKAIDDYSDDYASKVTASFFNQRDRITGADIRGLCPVEQVNLFVIRELLRAWKHEGQKLQSPFFDYDHPEVREALAKFQNLLSNHISIARQDFQPLLKKAVSQTLYLILNPYDFYASALERLGQEIQLAEIRQEVKYLRINRGPLDRLAERLAASGRQAVSPTEAFALLDRILEEVNFAPEEVGGYLGRFGTMLPVQADRFYETRLAPPKPTTVKNAPKPVVAPAGDGKTTLAENFQRIARIKDSLTINQKFMFTKILFHGDFEIFSQAVERLDAMDTLPQALAYVTQSFPEWDTESEEYEEFVELIRKRFA
ncbi:MAG: hypothetical protein MUC38_04705 [Cyclobacteriaceae bacterium]|jgi:hypothetical protein|nr:hypothetical protein [Cyclobacteriaceae bacterium]